MLEMFRKDRFEPISRKFGFDLGTPIDRFYIESFLKQYSRDFRGRSLEIGSVFYTERIGSCSEREAFHFGNIQSGIPSGDLTGENSLEDSVYDCIVVTQTLHVIFDFRKALANLYRSLAPGGVILITAPGISQISRYDYERWGDFWRFTDKSLERCLREGFPTAEIQVQSFGNLLAAKWMLEGRPVEKVKSSDLEHKDIEYQVLVGALLRKTKS